MSKVKKIGCLDPEALNYNPNAEVACNNCCNDAFVCAISNLSPRIRRFCRQIPLVAP